jgi:ABC-type multidrug transport system fused ATPase/permease subunit
VGENGAGKTTITKLITGLYNEFEGEILINGVSIRLYTLAQLKSLCSVVFQDFSKYSISFGENIAVGDINIFENDREKLLSDNNKLDFNDNIDKTDTGLKIKKAVELFNMAEAVDKLPGKYNTALGKIKDDGVDLSGGEWQLVAMARAVMSSAQLKILDEPTAALDPIGESHVYSEFEKISRGTTTIFISHRLGSTKLADTILVVGGGKIIEQGSHNELMASDGIYARMYLSQSEWYKTKNKYTDDPVAEMN